MQEEVDQKTIALAVKTGKLTAQVLQAAIRKYLAARQKDRTTHPPRYIVIFKSKQADNLEQAFKEFTAKKLKQQERPSIRKTLAVLKEKAAARSSQQAKEKIKERGLSR